MRRETYPRAWPIALFFAFLTLFWCLPSRDYLAVDGALRCLGVYFDPTLLFHGNNHLLYPFWVSLWSRLAHAIGIRASDAFQFMRMSQAMNGFFGAASIALLCSILQLLVEDRIALLCSLIFGFSTALSLHSTNAAEPLPGLFFSLLGVRVLMAALLRHRRSLLILAGVCLSLALASYQAMGTIAGVAAFACVWWSWTRSKDAAARDALGPLLSVALGGLLGVCGIYGFAYSHQNIPLLQMPHQFFSIVGSEIYSGISVSNILNVPFGLLRNLFSGVPLRYTGIRALLRDPQRMFWIPAAIAGLATVGAVTWMASKALWRVSRKWPRRLILAGLGAIALLCLPLVYWDAAYDKLWLLPLAVATAVVAIGFRPELLGPGERKVLTTLLIIVLATEMSVSLPRVWESHFTATPHLADAEDVNRLIQPRDLVVLDFDNVSTLWLAFWGQRTQFLLLPSSNLTSASQWLAAARQSARRTDARIIFIGVLDQDRQSWENFLGKRVGIPFSLLDEYRDHATILQRYSLENGSVTLRAYK